MKNLLFTLTVVLFATVSEIYAQTGIKFGVKTGYSIGTQYATSSSGEGYTVKSGARSGFTGALFFYFPVTESFGVQQEFVYTQKGSEQDVTINQAPALINSVSHYKANYFEMPVVIRYTFLKIKNISIYGNTGIALSLMRDGKYDVAGTVTIPNTPEIPFEESGNLDQVDEFDYSFIYGFGASFPFLKKELFLEYRQTIGWNTLMMPTYNDGEPAPLRNMTYAINLGIYF